MPMRSWFEFRHIFWFWDQITYDVLPPVACGRGWVGGGAEGREGGRGAWRRSRRGDPGWVSGGLPGGEGGGREGAGAARYPGRSRVGCLPSILRPPGDEDIYSRNHTHCSLTEVDSGKQYTKSSVNFNILIVILILCEVLSTLQETAMVDGCARNNLLLSSFSCQLPSSCNPFQKTNWNLPELKLYGQFP